MFQAFATHYPVKGVVGKGQGLNITSDEAYGFRCVSDSPLRNSNCGNRKIDACNLNVRNSASEPHGKLSTTTPKFQKIASQVASDSAESRPVPWKRHGIAVLSPRTYSFMPSIVGKFRIFAHDDCFLDLFNKLLK